MLIARLAPEQVGRAFPLSAEKLSPILAFYAVANLAAGIELCQRLLAFGGLGHTCAIHSQNDAAIRKFGQAVPAFRVCVNTSAVHGSIGYSTNLFPAMTLGCGAPGGNITSDNIGPQHLMNVKRIAWESRPVEHRSVPADQRMASTLRAETVSAAATAAAAGAGSAGEGRREATPVATPAGATAAAAAASPERTEAPPVAAPAAPPDATTVALGGIDRARIAVLVEQVLSAIQYRARKWRCGCDRPRLRWLVAASRAGSAAASPAEISQAVAFGDRGGNCQSSVWLRCGLRGFGFCSGSRWICSGGGAAHGCNVSRNAALATERHDFPIRQRERRAPRVDPAGENLHSGPRAS